MAWIVKGLKDDEVILISKSGTNASLPKGTYLTVEDEDKKYVLRVDKSGQIQKYDPSTLIIDMDLTPLYQDQKCQNILHAYRVRDIPTRQDGWIDFIKPQLPARRSTQQEIDIAIGSRGKGPIVLIA